MLRFFLFIYTKQTSDLWDCCKTMCITGLGDIDQLVSVDYINGGPDRIKKTLNELILIIQK